jgi:hypothetical protein
MKTKTLSGLLSLAGPAALLALLAAGALAGRVLELPVPSLAVGTLLALLGLRIWVMLDAVRAPAEESAPRRQPADAAEPALRAAHG